jgi:hypothetical protein
MAVVSSAEMAKLAPDPVSRDSTLKGSQEVGLSVRCGLEM